MKDEEIFLIKEATYEMFTHAQRTGRRVGNIVHYSGLITRPLTEDRMGTMGWYAESVLVEDRDFQKEKQWT